jgi:hypothetical protein
MRHAWLPIVLAACKQGSGDYPINPGGDDVGDFHPQPDAPPMDQSLGDSAMMITGRVCLLSDVRQPGACAGTGAGNITVQLGTASALTADDGAFSLISPGGANLVWNVSAADLVPSVMPLGASNLLYAVPAVLYEDMLTTNSVVVGATEGAIVVFVRDQSGPVQGADVAVTPASATYDPLYDTADAVTWAPGDTGPFGASWVPALGQGTATVTVTPPSAGAQVVNNVPVAGGALTFLTVTF